MGTRILAVVWPTLRSRKERQPADPRFERMLDRLDELSPRVESPGSGGVALADVTGLGALIGDERRVAARAAALVRQVEPLPVRLGIGDNRWLASVAARRAIEHRVASLERIEPGSGRAYLAELPVTLLPADPGVRARFALFGLTVMGELAALPRSAVVAQFGVAGERLQALARGEDPRRLVPRRRPDRVSVELPFEPAVERLEAVAFVLRRGCGELCDLLRRRHRAPGRATLELRLDDAPPIRIEVLFPQPALEPEWIARLLLGRLEVRSRGREASLEDPRITAIALSLDRLSDPAARQLPAFEPQAGRWEELRWSLERIRSRFGEARLWRAVHARPTASLAEHRARLLDIGEAGPP